jgi:hypothetical protein
MSRWDVISVRPFLITVIKTQARWEEQFCKNFVRVYLSRYSDLLQAGRSGDRIPIGAWYSAPVHTSPGDHPASYTMGTTSFQGVKWLERGIDHPPPSSTKVKEIIELYL